MTQGAHVQGLQASVTILDAELVSIDRQQQCITLSDQTRVQYGLLVLTVGLQPSCSLAAHQLSNDSQQVCSLQDLQLRIPKVSRDKLCVAEETTLQRQCMMQYLHMCPLNRHVKGANYMMSVCFMNGPLHTTHVVCYLCQAMVLSAGHDEK